MVTQDIQRIVIYRADGTRTTARNIDQVNAALGRTTARSAAASAGVGGFSQALRTATPLMGAFGVSLGAVGLLQFGAGAISAGDELAKLSDRTGISARSLSGWRDILERGDLTLDQFRVGVVTLQRNLADAARGVGEARDVLAELQIDPMSLLSESSERQILAVFAALNRMESATERNRAAQRLLGESGTQLATIMGTTQAEVDAAADTSDRAAHNAAAFRDQMTDLTDSFREARDSLVLESGLLPAITDLIELSGQSIDFSINFRVPGIPGLTEGGTLGAGFRRALELQGLGFLLPQDGGEFVPTGRGTRLTGAAGSRQLRAVLTQTENLDPLSGIIGEDTLFAQGALGSGRARAITLGLLGAPGGGGGGGGGAAAAAAAQARRFRFEASQVGVEGRGAELNRHLFNAREASTEAEREYHLALAENTRGLILKEAAQAAAAQAEQQQADDLEEFNRETRRIHIQERNARNREIEARERAAAAKERLAEEEEREFAAIRRQQARERADAVRERTLGASLTARIRELQFEYGDFSAFNRRFGGVAGGLTPQTADEARFLFDAFTDVVDFFGRGSQDPAFDRMREDIHDIVRLMRRNNAETEMTNDLLRNENVIINVTVGGEVVSTDTLLRAIARGARAGQVQDIRIAGGL